MGRARYAFRFQGLLPLVLGSQQALAFVGIRSLRPLVTNSSERTVVISTGATPFNSSLGTVRFITSLVALQQQEGKRHSIPSTRVLYSSSTMEEKGVVMDLEPVSIDHDATQKYAVIVAETDTEKKMFIRGDQNAEYHKDAARDTLTTLRANGYKAEVTGGGRIVHDSGEKEILVYGYSVDFGQADHEKTAEMLREVYPDYQVDWNNEGY